MADVEALTRDAHARLQASGSSERQAVLSGGYAPSGLRILGNDAATLRSLAREMAQQLRGAGDAEVLAVVDGLVHGGTMEGRLLGYLLLERHRQVACELGPRAVEALGRGNDSWVTVDTFGSCVSGPAWLRGRLDDATVLRWARSRDLWWRRCALATTVPLNQKSKGGTGDARRTLAVCELLVDDHEDMVVKAMSWALRSLSGFDRRAVERFLAKHESVLHKRVLREVRSKLTTGRKNKK
jgi:3-methyladenine DNA glycosylase AlkD